MARCDVCGRDLKTALSCDLEARNDRSPLSRDGVVYTPVRWGHDLKFNRLLIEGGTAGGRIVVPRERCRDCHVLRGGFHHLGCCREECPRCGAQLLTCGCFDTPGGPPLPDTEFS